MDSAPSPEGASPPGLILRTSWGQRAWGVIVLAAAAAAGAALWGSGGAPWLTWGVIGGLALIAVVASVANFGDSWRLDDAGISYENVVTARVGWARRRHASWDAVLSAVEHEKRTWFLHVDGQPRWVLDHVDGHEALRALLEARGVSISKSRRPRLLQRTPFGQ